MHLLDRYALSTGSKIGKPFIVKKFFPIPAEKYITVQNSSGMPGKCYSYFQDVINFLVDELNKNNIKIVQIGGAEDIPLNHAIHLQGKTQINQTAYIIENSMLHLGNDSFAIHMASAFDIPLVGLYSITSPEIAGPYWKNEKQITLSPKDCRPSFNPNENPKKIDQIKIEDVVNSCYKLLFNKQTNLKTVYIGKRYSDKVVESTPNHATHPDFFKGAVLNVRFDFAKDIINLANIMQNLSFRQCSIVTKQDFPIENLLQYKNNIACVIYDITNGFNKPFIEKLNNLGIKYVCIFNNSKKQKLEISNLRMELMDFCDVQETNSVPNDIPDNLFGQNFKYKSNRIILDNQKIYPSYSALLQDINTTEHNSQQNLDDLKDWGVFQEDIEYCYIYSNNA